MVWAKAIKSNCTDNKFLLHSTSKQISTSAPNYTSRREKHKRCLELIMSHYGPLRSDRSERTRTVHHIVANPWSEKGRSQVK